MHKQGDIVLIPIPFIDLTSSKKRPVLIISNDTYNKSAEDIIVIAITSNLDGKMFGLPLIKDSLSEGTLLHDSYIRADKIYTLSQDIVIKKFGAVKKEILDDVLKKVIQVLALERLMHVDDIFIATIENIGISWSSFASRLSL